MKELDRFFKNIHKIWFAGFLWLITSIPVVTIGTATTALIYTEMQIRRGTLRSTVSESFFRSFKDNLKNGTILFLIYGALIGGLMALANSLAGNSGADATAQSPAIVRYIVVGLLIVVAMSAAFVFAVQARFTNTVKGTILYSCVMSTRNLLYTAVILVTVYVLIRVCTAFFPVALIIVLAAGVGIIFYLFALMYCRVFLPYIPDEKRTEDERAYAAAHHIPSGIENAASPAAAETSAHAEQDMSAEEAADGDAVDRADAPTGIYPRGRKHSMADIIAATANEAEDDEE